MTTPTRSNPAVLGLLAILLLGACSGAAAPPPASGAPPDPGHSAAAPSTDPGGNAGGGSSGNPGQPDPAAPIGGVGNSGPIDPGLGQPKLVIPRPGQRDPRPVAATAFQPAVTGRRVLVKVTWWSGIEPCSVLDSVDVHRTGTTFTIQLVEGTGDANAVCIDIAEQKATIVDLGELDPGTYTISGRGQGAVLPPSVTVTVN